MNKHLKCTTSIFLTAIILSACTPVKTEAPAIPFQGKPVTFPINFIKFANAEYAGVSPTCNYKMGSQQGVFTVPATVNLKFTDQKQTLFLNCSVDESVPQTKNLLGIKARQFKGAWSWSADTTFRRETSYYATGPIGDSRRIRVPHSYAAKDLRELLIEKKGVQILPYRIVVAPKKGSVEKQAIY